MPPRMPRPLFAAPSRLVHRRIPALAHQAPTAWACRSYADEAASGKKPEPKPITLDDLLGPGPSSTPSPSSPRSPTPAEDPTEEITAENAPQPSRRPMPPLRSLMLPFAERMALRAGDSDPLRRRPGSPVPYSLIVNCTHQNTFMTLTHTPVAYLPGSHPGNEAYVERYPMAGKVVYQTGAAHVGFLKAKRKSYEGATQAALKMFDKIRELCDPPRGVDLSKLKPAQREGPPSELEVVFKGFGPGREAVQAALSSAQAGGVREMVRRYRDATPITIGGPRLKKRRIV